MGGGRQVLVSNVTNSTADPYDSSRWGCLRKDGRDLIKTYRKDKERRSLKYSIVSNNKELQALDEKNTDYLLGKQSLLGQIPRVILGPTPKYSQYVGSYKLYLI